MKYFKNLCLVLFAFIIASNAYAFESKTLDMFDKGRGRNIPVVVYQGETANKQVVIISHGYGAKNTEYSFIAQALASRGYFVVSIQHDLVTEVRPKTGTLWERRKPFWARGVQNILFVMSELKKIEPQLDLSKVILIGHSDGGDASMMLAQTYPQMVSKVISLDSRVSFPKKSGIRDFTLGSNR